jgi:hypothetical protein
MYEFQKPPRSEHEVLGRTPRVPLEGSRKREYCRGALRRQRGRRRIKEHRWELVSYLRHSGYEDDARLD